jgi:LysR family glycine cleavage system transcriptional activator
LEHHLGRPLFHRLPRGLALTGAGIALAPLITEVLGRLESGTASIFGERPRQSLRVCATASFSLLWLAPRLVEFRESYPLIDFRLTSSIWPTAQADPALDLEIRFGDGAWPGLCAERLTHDELFPVCSPVLVERVSGIDAPIDLTRTTLLHTFGFRGDWTQWLEQVEGGSSIDPIAGLEFDLAAVTLDLAERGLGVALGRTCYVRDRLRDGCLVAPFAQRIPAGDDFYLLYPKERILEGPALAFRDWLHEACLDLLPAP